MLKMCHKYKAQLTMGSLSAIHLKQDAATLDTSSLTNQKCILRTHCKYFVNDKPVHPVRMWKVSGPSGPMVETTSPGNAAFRAA